MLMLCRVLAEAESFQEVKSGWGGLVFTGVFFLLLIGVGIWWLSRG